MPPVHFSKFLLSGSAAAAASPTGREILSSIPRDSTVSNMVASLRAALPTNKAGQPPSTAALKAALFSFINVG